MEFDRVVRRRGMVREFDAAFASMLTLLTVVNEGLGACFVGAFDDEAVRQVLGLPAHVVPVGVIPVGYPAEHPSRYRRRPLQSQVHTERWEGRQR